MSSMLPFHVPVEKPANVCAASALRGLAAVEPDRALLFLEVHAQVNREHALRQRIEDLLDAHVREPAHRVVAAVRPALILRDDGDPSPSYESPRMRPASFNGMPE